MQQPPRSPGQWNQIRKPKKKMTRRKIPHLTPALTIRTLLVSSTVAMWRSHVQFTQAAIIVYCGNNKKDYQSRSVYCGNKKKDYQSRSVYCGNKKKKTIKRLSTCFSNYHNLLMVLSNLFCGWGIVTYTVSEPPAQLCSLSLF